MNHQWLTACALAQMGAPPLIVAPTAGKTIRTELPCQRTGGCFRLVLGEKYSSQAVQYGKITVGVNGTQTSATFNGEQRLTVQPGETVYSDPIQLAVRRGQGVTLWLYHEGTAPGQSLCLLPQQHSAPGDYCGQDFEAEPYTNPLADLKLGELLGGVLGLQVLVDHIAEPDGIVAFGDSITALDIWVSPLRRTLWEKNFYRPVLNLGIGGNRLLRDTNLPAVPGAQIFGSSGLRRSKWDLLELTGIRTVLLALGINDISQPGASEGFSPPAGEVCTADGLKEGYRTMIRDAHDRGIQIIGATVTPFGGYATYTGEKESIRREINSWIMDSGSFDAVVDFASAICYKDHPEQLAPKYDSGDHLHPNAEGGLAMTACAAACQQL